MTAKKDSKHAKLLLLRLGLLVLSGLFSVFIISSTQFHNLIVNVRDYAYIGSFVTGIFFTSTFTVLPATVTLYYLSKKHNLVVIAFTGALGAMVGDNLLLRVIRSEVERNLYSFIIPKHKRALKKVLATKAVYWLIALLGIIVIASPLPDELGLTMLGLIHFKTRHFLFISFFVNFLGMLLLTLVAKSR